ncbi:Uncharacterised protein [Mycobacterium tuberculosis]|nr:Uncharacterised protein [Mycobacterium tuberculosis]
MIFLFIKVFKEGNKIVLGIGYKDKVFFYFFSVESLVIKDHVNFYFSRF